MNRIPLIIISLFLLASLVGCNSKTENQSNLEEYKDNDVAAIVGDKEITIGDLRLLYRDEEVLENIEGSAKLELLKQEVKRMGVDVTDDIHSQKESMLAISYQDIDNKSMREFIESQATKLGMKPDEYYKKYAEIRSEQDPYIFAYVDEMYGESELPKSAEELDAFNKKIDNSLNDLVKEHESKIKILIK